MTRARAPLNNHAKPCNESAWAPHRTTMQPQRRMPSWAHLRPLRARQAIRTSPTSSPLQLRHASFVRLPSPPPPFGPYRHTSTRRRPSRATINSPRPIVPGRATLRANYLTSGRPLCHEPVPSNAQLVMPGNPHNACAMHSRVHTCVYKCMPHNFCCAGSIHVLDADVATSGHIGRADGSRSH